MSPDELSRWFLAEVQPHEPALRGYLHGRTSADEIDDFVQDSYARVLQACERGPVLHPRGLLFATARNVVRDRIRRRMVAQTFPIAEIDESHVFDPAPDAAESVCRQQEVDLLSAAIADLPLRCREIFVLRKFENLSHREIAQRLGISEHTVEAQLTKGLRRCEEFFSRRGAFPRR